MSYNYDKYKFETIQLHAGQEKPGFQPLTPELYRSTRQPLTSLKTLPTLPPDSAWLILATSMED